MEAFTRLTPQESRLAARRFRNLAIVVAVLALILLVLVQRYAPDRPVTYEDELRHFYYGSIGAEKANGLPVAILRLLPDLFPEYLPPGGTGLRAFGFVQEPGQPLPIGFSVRRQVIDLTAPNCALCHTGVVRTTPGAAPLVVPGMPANTVDLYAFFGFLFKVAADPRFTAETIMPALERQQQLSRLERLLYPKVIKRMRRELQRRAGKLAWLFDSGYTPFGPGRVNTFDTFKFDQFAPIYEAHRQLLDADELWGVVDFPAVWHQAPRDGMRLHWDGNNTSVRERNFSAAIGAGARPQDMDADALYRLETWLMTLPAPKWPLPVDNTLVDRGREVYGQYCADCHDFSGSRVGTVVPLADIGTDRSRLDSYTPFLRQAQQIYTAGMPWAFSHFSVQNGYAAHPLDGIWARAPYLHNGSVPTLLDLLTPETQRPPAFTTGGTVLDAERLGFRYTSVAPGRSRLADGRFVLDTSLRGNSNRGHSGPAYGTELPMADKRALVEFLKVHDAGAAAVVPPVPARKASRWWLLVLLALAGTWLLGLLVERSRRAPTPPSLLPWAPGVTVQHEDVHGSRLRWVEQGQGSTVLLVHTLRTQLDLFQHTFAGLAEHHHVVALDLPGHGFSDIPDGRYTAEFFARYLRGFLEQRGLTDVTLVGESIGGALGLLLAAEQHPRVARVVAINSYDYGKGRGILRGSLLARILFTLTRVPVLGETIWRLRTLGAFKLVIRGSVHNPAVLPAELLEQMHAVGNRPGHLPAFLSLVRNFPGWEALRTTYPAIRIPVLLVYARHDWSTPAERAACQALVPGSTLVTLEAAGHLLSLEAPQAVLDTLLPFLATPPDQATRDG